MASSRSILTVTSTLRCRVRRSWSELPPTLPLVTRTRAPGRLGRGRPIAAAALLVAIPGIAHMAAVAALATVTAVCVALVAYEVLRHRSERAIIRSRRHGLSTVESD